MIQTRMIRERRTLKPEVAGKGISHPDAKPYAPLDTSGRGTRTGHGDPRSTVHTRLPARGADRSARHLPGPGDLPAEPKAITPSVGRTGGSGESRDTRVPVSGSGSFAPSVSNDTVSHDPVEFLHDLLGIDIVHFEKARGRHI